MTEAKGRPFGSTISVRKALLIGFVPVLMLLSAATVGSYLLSERIHSHMEMLSATAAAKLRYAHQASMNLETVQISLKTLESSPNHEHARQAYLTAWELLSESSLDRYQETSAPLAEVLRKIRRAWAERRLYDESRQQFLDYRAEVHARLFEAAALAPSFSSGRIPEMFSRMLIANEDEADDQIAAMREVTDRLSQIRAKTPEKRAELAARNAEIRKSLDLLSSCLDTVKWNRSRFKETIDAASYDIQELRRQYSKLETQHLVTDFGEVHHLWDYFHPLMVVLAASSLGIMLILIAGYFVMIRPIQSVTVVLRRYLENGEEPKWPRESRITEIRDVVGWLKLLTRLTDAERRRSEGLALRYAELKRTAELDSLTGVANRSALDALCSRAMSVPARTAVLMIDVDHFKRINDEHGHRFGDKILQTVAQRLRRSVSHRDEVYRYGGEEFCVVLEEVNEEVVASVAARLCERVREISKRDATVIPDRQAADPLTISIGASTVTRFAGESTFTSLIEEADRSLYEAKAAGRNCVRVTEPHAEP